MSSLTLALAVLAGSSPGQASPPNPSAEVVAPCPPLTAGTPGASIGIAPVRLPRVIPPLVIPDAPSALGDADILARVTVTAVVDLDGRPCDLRVATLSHPGFDLDSVGFHAVSQWRFEPATRDGNPVRAKVTFDFQFHPADSRGVWGSTMHVSGAEVPPRAYSRKSLSPPP